MLKQYKKLFNPGGAAESFKSKQSYSANYNFYPATQDLMSQYPDLHHLKS